jgi:DNA-binding CsgD family transcriptional regulator
VRVLDPDGVPARPDVMVLVAPEANDWDDARASGRPIVLVLGEEADEDEVVDAVLAGADAVLDCDDDPATVLRAVELVSEGGCVLEPTQIRAVARVARAAAARPGVVLSRRETQILLSISEGRAVKQTARDLGIAPKTVENLQGRLFRKLRARNRAQGRGARARHGLAVAHPDPSMGGIAPGLDQHPRATTKANALRDPRRNRPRRRLGPGRARARL